MPVCGRVTRVMVGAILLLAASSQADTDQLSMGRRQLRPAPCGAVPAVTAVAGVNPNPRLVYVGDWLLVSVCQLESVLEKADAAQVPLTLFIEGRDTSNEPVGIDVESGTLTFVIDRNETNRDLWRPFLYNPLFDPTVTMRVSVGLKGERPLPRVSGANLRITVQKLYVDWTTWIWF